MSTSRSSRYLSRLFISSLFVVSLVVAFSTASPALAEDDSVSEIVERALENNTMEFEAARAELSLVVEDDNGDRTEKKMVMKSKVVDGAVRTLLELTHPKDLKGQSFLFAENEGASDDVWMYVPAFEVTRRVEGSKKQGAFLGSHFTYDDLESRDVKAADYEKLEESTIGEDAVHVIRATPKKSASSAYGHVRLFIRTSDDVPLKFKFYDESDELVKTLFVEKLDETKSGRTYIEQMQMRSAEGGYTRLTIDSIETDVDLPESAFTKEQLGK